MSHPSSESRNLCSELASVLYEDGSRGIYQAVANLEEISSTGAMILVDEKLEPGLPVSIHARGYDLHGIVESSEFEQALGWFVQIEFDSTSRWNDRMFIPEHFITTAEFFGSSVTRFLLPGMTEIGCGTEELKN